MITVQYAKAEAAFQSVRCDRKILPFIALMVIGVIMMIFGTMEGFGEQEHPKIHTAGNDRDDVVAARGSKLSMSASILGRVTINGKMPLPRGTAVVYVTNSLSKAVGAGEIGNSGMFHIDNLPTGHVAILFKTQLSRDANPVARLVDRLPEADGLSELDASRDGRGKKGNPYEMSTPQFHEEAESRWLARRPKPAILKSIKFTKYSPEMSMNSAVEWLIEGAFLNYGTPFSGRELKTFQLEEGTNQLQINLEVP